MNPPKERRAKLLAAMVQEIILDMDVTSKSGDKVIIDSMQPPMNYLFSELHDAYFIQIQKSDIGKSKK